jgi:hypothetical protein
MLGFLAKKLGGGILTGSQAPCTDYARNHGIQPQRVGAGAPLSDLRLDPCAC